MENITGKLLSLSSELFFKILLFQIAFVILCAIRKNYFCLLYFRWIIIAACGFVSVQD